MSWQFEPAFSIHKLPFSTHLHQKLLFPSTQTIFQELPCRLNVQLTMLHVCVLVIFLFTVCLVHKVTIKQASQLHTIYALLSVCPLITLGFPVPSDLLPLVLLPLSCVLFFEYRFCIWEKICDTCLRLVYITQHNNLQFSSLCANDHHLFFLQWKVHSAHTTPFKGGGFFPVTNFNWTLPHSTPGLIKHSELFLWKLLLLL